MQGEKISTKISQEGDLTILKVVGDLDLMTVDDFRSAVLRIRDAPKLVLDLHEVQYLEGSGLGILFSLCKQRKERDLSRFVVLAMPRGSVVQAMSDTWLDRTIPIVSDISELTPALFEWGQSTPDTQVKRLVPLAGKRQCRGG